jgi:hypothetical protein
MWFVIVIFIIVFQMGVVLLAPSFGLTGGASVALPTVSVNTTADVIAAGTNPLSLFGDILTFQLPGGEAIGAVFWLLDILLIICVIKLIRG